jgi:hypothetical protein
MKWEFNIVDRSLVGLLVGFSYLPKQDTSDYTELNIYLLIIVLHFKFY